MANARVRRARVLAARRRTHTAWQVVARYTQFANANPGKAGVWYSQGAATECARDAEVAELTAADAPRRTLADPMGFGPRAGRGEFRR